MSTRSRSVFVLSVLLSILFIGMGGITKLAGAQFQRDTFAHFGYPAWFMYVIGGIELVCGLLILSSKSRFLAASSMVTVTIGVVFSMVRVGEVGIGTLASPPVVVMVAAGFVAWRCRPFRANSDRSRSNRPGNQR